MNETIEEISIKDVINSALSLKLYFIALAIFISLVALFFLANKNNIWRGSIPIKSITTIQFFPYSELTPLINEIQYRIHANNSINFDENDKGNMERVYPEGLEVNHFYFNIPNLKEFVIEEILDRKEIIQSLKDMNIIDYSEYSDEKKYDIELFRLAYSLSIQYFEKSGPDKNDDYYLLTFDHDNQSEIEMLFEYVLNRSNQRVIEFIKSFIVESKQRYKDSIAYAESVVKLKIQNAEADYQRKKMIKINFLKEQETIARRLGIETSNFTIDDLTLFRGPIENIREIQPYYLRGYRAIESERLALEGRNKNEEDVDYLSSYQSVLFDLQQDTFYDRYSSIANKFILSDNFMASRFNVAELKYENMSLSNINLLIICIVSFLVLSFSILTLNLIVRIYR